MLPGLEGPWPGLGRGQAAADAPKQQQACEPGSQHALVDLFPFGGLQSDYRKQGATQTPQQKCRLRILNGSKPRATAWQGSAGMQESCKDNPCEARWQAALPCGQRRLG